MLIVGVLAFAAAVVPLPPRELEQARDKQDRSALERIASTYGTTAAKQPTDAQAQYEFARAQSYLAEVATELKDKNGGRTAAEAGIKAAEQAVALKAGVAEYHRLLGTLCGQLVPANVLAGLKYGKCAMQSINKAIELDPKSALAYVSRGVGNYYLPAAFGGGPEIALKDFDQAIQLDTKLAEAHLWRGLALRKLNRNVDARAAFSKSLQLNPARVWTKLQLEKTPPQ
ncbi:MAG TPA: tetratricopeptide repeat protein [Bryobacteraceae bacterium]|nr:tetratricopeptide repeat protein [Bryobacteraceae bacterium]